MNKRIVSAIAILVILTPNLITILDYKKSLYAFNSAFEFLGINTVGTHFSLGEWAVMYYSILMPLFTLVVFIITKESLGFGRIGKSITWIFFLLSSILAWHCYIEGIVFLSL